MNKIPVIFGIKNESLSDVEKDFFRSTNPFGYILFTRNCKNPKELKFLTASLRELSGEEIPILIDQEGGRVARLKPPFWREYPPAGEFIKQGLTQAKIAVYENALAIGTELKEMGINVNCVPLADVPMKNSHNIIGNRAFSNNPEIVVILAAEMARGMQNAGVSPVLKHLPGHGRANIDSHYDLPIVNASLEELRTNDFIPFKALQKLPYGMTAHIKYTAIDSLPATLSPKIIKQIIRDELGFKGILMSDDISMKALNGDLANLAKTALNAGCDIILHCNANMAEMQQIVKGIK